MSARAWQMLKGALLVFVALVVWAALELTIGHSWHEETALGVPVEGVTGLWKIELLSNLPDFAYFLLIGALLFYLSGPSRTIWWAGSFAVLAMVIKAAARNYTFPEGPGIVGVGLLFIDLALPAVFAFAGALVARTISTRRYGGERAT